MNLFLHPFQTPLSLLFVVLLWGALAPHNCSRVRTYDLKGLIYTDLIYWLRVGKLNCLILPTWRFSIISTYYTRSTKLSVNLATVQITKLLNNKCKIYYNNSVKKLTLESIKELFPRVDVRRYGKNQIICYQGDKPQYVFFVINGHIKYYDIDDDGDENILHIVGPQNIFPMLYAFGVSSEIGAFYAAIDAVEVITIPLHDFHKVIETNIEFSNALTRWFLTEIEQLVFRINSFEKTDSRAKIMHALKYLSVNYGQPAGAWQRIDFVTTQQFLADFTGLTRETVSTIMNELEKANTVRFAKGHQLEISSAKLNKIK